jgi:tetratricopeptide (TPR) repeat protein
VRRPLADLTRVYLINESTSGRFGFHDLLRAYAVELTHRYESREAREAATRRALDFYLHTAYAAARLTNQHRTPITLNRPDPAVVPEALAEPDAWAWLTREYPVLRAAITTAVTAGFDTHAWQLAWSVSEFLQFRGDWHDWRSTQTTALAAARRLSDPLAQANSHRLIAGASIFLKDYEDAHHHLMCALELHRASGDRKMQARIHTDLSVVLADQGRTPEGITHAEQAAHLSQEEGDWVGLASALNGTGWMYAQLGDYHRALAYCQQALAVQQRVGERVRQSSTWDSLGYIHHQLGQHDEAAESYRRALEMARENRDRHLEATVLTHIGDAQLAAGDPAAAGKALRNALTILEELKHPDADQVRAKLHAEPVATSLNPAG